MILCSTCVNTKLVIKRSPVWWCTVKNHPIRNIKDELCKDYIESAKSYHDRQKRMEKANGNLKNS